MRLVILNQYLSSNNPKTHFWAVILLLFSSINVSADNIKLSEVCPPSFTLNNDNRCYLRHMYQLYDSLQNSGIGGLKTGLPEPRDGFSHQQFDLGR